MCTNSTHNHSHEHHHDNNEYHIHTTDTNEEIFAKINILHENDMFSERIKGYLDAKKVFSVNLMSSPGAGKTTLLEQTIKRLSPTIDINVIEGDQHTENDANRIKALNIPAIQINTGNGCHLESFSVYNAIKHINPQPSSILFIENVGNLVCPDRKSVV